MRDSTIDSRFATPDGPLADGPPAPRTLRDRLLGRRSRQPRIPDGARVYAIGDIHGRYDLFDTLLDRIQADSIARGAARTTLILLGDLIDRGPDSAAVVARARIGVDWADITVLSGNHEQAMADALDGDRDMLRLWLEQGGDAALASWGVDPDLIAHADLGTVLSAAIRHIPLADRQWIAALPTAVGHGDYHFVHAGIRPGVPLARQSRRDALWIRQEFLNSRRDHGVMVVHGHTVSHRVDHRANRIGIDTGAYASGRLTALGLEGTERWTLSTPVTPP